MNGLGRLVLATTGRPTVRRVFTETRTGRRLSLRFVAGETLDEAADAAAALNAAGAAVSLDHLGEHVVDPTDAVAARDAYLTCIDRIAVDGLDANISVKLTQLGMGFDDGLAVESLGALAGRAAAAGTTVFVDMEESAHTETTLSIFEKVQSEHGNLGVAVQSYLRRTRADLDRIVACGGHVRLCKGAYAEPPDVALQTTDEVDRAFDVLLRVMMDTTEIIPAIATHDPARIELARILAVDREEPWEFQLLYGVRRRLQRELIDAGHPLRVYVPYGTAWYPYLTRRMAERPANLLFFLRAAFGR